MRGAERQRRRDPQKFSQVAGGQNRLSCNIEIGGDPRGVLVEGGLEK
jgi:hypothetical protein